MSSPLRQKSLPAPGQSLDEELTRLRDINGRGYLFFIACVAILAVMEWYGYFFGMPRPPWLFTGLAVVSGIVAYRQFRHARTRAEQIRLGRDGERLVGQSLKALRAIGASILHDVPGDGFNLDHVVICDRGVVVVETKTWSKPERDAKIAFDGDQLLVAGRKPRHDPLLQVRAQIRWLSNLLEQLTGEVFPVRGALVFPGWWCDPAPPGIRHDIWVLEPQALPSFIEQESVRLSVEQISRATIYLSNFVRRVAQ